MKKFVNAPGCKIPASKKTLLINSKILVGGMYKQASNAWLNVLRTFCFATGL